jgi:DNA-directed RNA polymerase sigma subunit (sigma70/sigma32)
VKPLELTLTLRNNLLKGRRRQLGFSCREMAEAVGIGYPLYLQYEAMTLSPVNRATCEWNPSAKAVARYFGVEPAELWPKSVLCIKQNKVVAEMTAEALLAFESFESERAFFPSPADVLLREEQREALGRALEALSPIDRDVIVRRFGLEGGEPETLDEIGPTVPRRDAFGRERTKKKGLSPLGVSRMRVLDIEHNALSEMRRALLRLHIGPSDILGEAS